MSVELNLVESNPVESNRIPRRIYAGIGSRETPPDILDLMARMGVVLAQAGFTLRSGAAPGADSAFEAGCDRACGLKEVFIPWNNFQERLTCEDGIYLVPVASQAKAEVIASGAHPRWQFLKQGAKKLHTRNVCQILGADLETPVDFVICWTPGGEGGGGTGQALRIAKAQTFLIPILDLGAPEALDRFTAISGVAL